MIRFIIHYPPTKAAMAEWNRRYGLNAYYSGKHYQQRKKDADALHKITLCALKKAGIKKILLKNPVEVRFYWDDRLDIDNHAVLGKAILDAMKGWILHDDNRRWVRKVSHEFWNGGEIRIEIEEVKR